MLISFSAARQRAEPRRQGPDPSAQRLPGVLAVDLEAIRSAGL